MNCYLIGAGNNSKTIIDLLFDNNITILGIFDDDCHKIYNYKEVKILGTIFDINMYNLVTDNFFITIGNPISKLNILNIIKKPLIYPNFIHSSCIISDTVKLGYGNIIYPFVCIQSDTIIGNHNMINMSTTIGHDVIIRDNNIISPQVSICGNINIGNNNFIGSKCVIIPHKQIGNNNIIGSATNVINSIKNNIKTVGNPNKIIQT